MTGRGSSRGSARGPNESADTSAVDRGERFLVEASGTDISPSTNVARGLAATLEALVEVLIPGDELFPSALKVGAHGLLGGTVRKVHGQPALDAISEGLVTNKRMLHQQSHLDRVETVRRFEREEPELFSFIRMVAYYSYYKDPLVTRAIRALGHDYNDSPQPEGYDMVPFDPSVNAPANPRGRYVQTAAVVPVDPNELDFDFGEGSDE